MDWTVPRKPDPLYSFFPIYSPFKVEDNDGFDLGADNKIKSIYVKDGALRFEMQAILRPGRFLGNHYIAFTLPMRTFLITLDRVLSGVRQARKNKRETQAALARAKQGNDSYLAAYAQSISHQEDLVKRDDLQFAEPRRKNGFAAAGGVLHLPKPKPKKSFFSRFVEGYLGVSKNEEVRNEHVTTAISEWFGRQGRNKRIP